ncbi:FtsK/SpoIIIE domain-containing protein [Streptomyces marincola]|uniref:FtsK/SpoIIIE domain-containing protein n=1 Tax=Streptomyces marincola TaxID=2878388 RepID=UPI001CF25ED9|nr:FtsK/SpoIIIE domain-containing protein [Streptomyces marincola]UCM88363.1 FHA domain-containing protein [Streptomyces marincola]
MPLHIRLTVLAHGDAATGTDVEVTAPAGTALAGVLGSLAAAAAPGTAPPGAVFCEGVRVDPQAVLGAPPLVDGAVLAFHRPVGEPVGGPTRATLLVVAGPDAGGVHLLRGGEARIGRSAEADIPLDDPDVSRAHCAVALSPDGSVTVRDLGSTNGTLLNGAPVGPRPVPARSGALLRLGESVLRVIASAEPQAPPPGPPPAPAGGRRGLAGWALGRRAGQGPPAEPPPPVAPPATSTASTAPTTSTAHAESRWPDPAGLLLTAIEAGPRLWERDAAHPDAYTVRLGTVQQAPDMLPPVTVALPLAGSLGLAGPRGRITGVARSVLAQLAGLHPPGALQLVAVAPGRADDWSWLGWLPHVRPAEGQDCRLLLAFDPRQAAARTRELTESLARPRPDRRTVVLVDGDPGDAQARDALARLAAQGPAAGIHLLVLGAIPPAAAVPPEGVPAAATLARATAGTPLLDACGTVAVLSGPVSTALRLSGPAGDTGPTAGADAVSAAWAERFARALAPVAEEPGDGAATPAASPLPASCRLLDALGLSRVTPTALRERWSRHSGLPLVLGTGARGPVSFDLAPAPGPLAVTGGPGSGRTELLSGLAAALAAAHAPDALSLLLVEGAGEGLRPCAELPHVTSYVTATDPVRMRAFAQALREELKRRAALLGEREFSAARRAGGRLVALRSAAGSEGQAAETGALPWLVLLVDDLDALTAPALGAPGRPAAGSVVRALEMAVREGHRLGVRLVAAGDLPGAAARVVLSGKPQGRAELVPSAAGLGEAAEAVPFQAGRVTARIPRTSTLRPTVARLDWERAGDPPARRPVRELGNGPTDIALLASAAARAARTDHADRAATATPV